MPRRIIEFAPVDLVPEDLRLLASGSPRKVEAVVAPLLVGLDLIKLGLEPQRCPQVAVLPKKSS